MNILPHKSWNPWSSKNIEKVRKDEEAHQREQERLEKRSRQADSEARFDFLREQSSKRRKLGTDGSFVASGSSSSSSDSSPVVQRHERVAASDLTTSELFASLEAPQKEPKKEQTTATTAPRRHPFAPPPRTGALGEGSHDLEHKRPFYEKAAQCDLTPETDARFRRDRKRQTLEDPLTLFRSHSSPKLLSSSSSSSSEGGFRAPLAPPPSAHISRSDEVPKKAPAGSSADDLVLEKLRRERIERERRERQRAEEALRPPPSRSSRPHSASFSSSSSSTYRQESRAGRVRGREF